MTKCPFCQYDNEDGALFCEQCKSDLGILEGSPPEPVPAAISEITPEVMAKETPFPEQTVPVASPVGAGNSPARGGSFPVASPVNSGPSSSRGGQEAAKAAAATSVLIQAGSGIESSPTAPFLSSVGDTLDSVKTFVPPDRATAEVQATPRPSRDTDVLPTGGKPALLVLRGQKVNVEYPIYDGDNFVGRTDEKPVDIDLEDQEPPDRIWSSRQHARIRCQEGILVIEDLNSSNGTFINRTRLYPGQKRVLNINDVIQIGTVQMKVVIH
jgi:hypothetical protein